MEPVLRIRSQRQESLRRQRLAASTGRTIEVPKDFPTLQQAVDAARSGDRIVVGVGHLREQVVIEGKSLTIEGSDPERLCQVEASAGPALAVKGGATVALRHLSLRGGMATPDVPGDALVACGSRLALEGCDVQGGEGRMGIGAAAVTAHSMRSLRITGCQLRGGDGKPRRLTSAPMHGGPALRACNSDAVVVEESRLIGGDGSAGEMSRPAGSGGAAIQLRNVPQAAFRSVTASGGRGGNAAQTANAGEPAARGGSGGPGLDARHGSRAIAIGLSLAGGSSGHGSAKRTHAPKISSDEPSALLAEPSPRRGHPMAQGT
jgi:hypothetical protein